MGKNRKVKGGIGLNKFTFILVFIYFLCGVGGSYAYFAFSEEESSVIVGNVMSIDADLSVELLVGNNDGLVPMTDAALSNAINGVGSDNGACIDSLGNLSCQVYKITLTNNGSRLQHLTGTIELYAKDGIDNAYSNLKWQELTDPTTVKSGTVVNSMKKSVLVSELTLDSKESMTWYVGLWLSEIDADQRNSDKGEFGGIVTFESVEMNVLAETFMIPNAQSDENIDFSKTSEETETNGIYLKSGTETDTYPIYYYRGTVDNNLIFAGLCWKVVRTTETGGLKLIYNGVPTDESCNNTGTASQINTRQFNSGYKSPTYVGYMYGTAHTYGSKTMTDVTDTYYYGNDVVYSNGVYTLQDTITNSNWATIYNGGLNNNHYTCLSTGVTCTEVYYVYYTEAETAYYMTLTGGKKIEDILDETLNYNTTSSTIKGNSTTSGSLDYWYYTNLSNNYGDYVEDTVWCNDRSIYAKNGWDPDGGSTRDQLRFGSYGRARKTYNPSVTCEREIDSFTVSTVNGNGALDYPVGLLTVDELILAGGSYNKENSTYYLNTGEYWWSVSPCAFYGSIAGV